MFPALTCVGCPSHHRQPPSGSQTREPQWWCEPDPHPGSSGMVQADHQCPPRNTHPHQPLPVHGRSCPVSASSAGDGPSTGLCSTQQSSSSTLPWRQIGAVHEHMQRTWLCHPRFWRTLPVTIKLIFLILIQHVVNIVPCAPKQVLHSKRTTVPVFKIRILFCWTFSPTI